MPPSDSQSLCRKLVLRSGDTPVAGGRMTIPLKGAQASRLFLPKDTVKLTVPPSYFTPKSIVSLIVEMIEPYQGRVYDPAMGSGGFFVQSERFIEEHGDTLGDIKNFIVKKDVQVCSDNLLVLMGLKVLLHGTPSLFSEFFDKLTTKFFLCSYPQKPLSSVQQTKVSLPILIPPELNTELTSLVSETTILGHPTNPVLFIS